jgi:hypothetical protein
MVFVSTSITYLLQWINEQNERLKEEEKRQKEAEENERKRMVERKIQLDRLHQYQVAYQTICEEIAKAAGYVSLQSSIIS